MSGIFQGLMNFIQTAFATFSDNFNRTTSGSLGTSSSGGVWNAETGVWNANGYSATTATSPSTYPLADINMTSSSNTSSISVGSTFVFSASGSISTVTATTNGYTVVITGLSSTGGLAVGQWISATNGTGSLGSDSDIQIVSVDSSSQITLEVQATIAPTTGTITNVSTRNNDGGAGVALWVTDSGNWWGVTYGRSTNTSCNCSTCATYACSGFTNYVSGSYCGVYAYYVSASCTGGYSYATNYGPSSYSYSTNYGVTAYSYAANYGVSSYSYAITGYGCTGGYSYSANYACSAYSPVCIAYSNNYSCSAYSVSHPCTTYYPGACTGYGVTSYSNVYYKGGSYYIKGSSSNYGCTSYGYACSSYGNSYSCSTYGISGSSCSVYVGNACSTYTVSSYTGPTCNGYGASGYSGPNANYGLTSYSGPLANYGIVSYSGPNVASYGITSYSGPNCNSYTNNYYGPVCAVYYSTYAPYCSSPVYGYTSCNCQTCFPGYIRLIQSSGNVVSEIYRWGLSQLAAAFKVATNAVTKVITIKPYSNTNLTTQIGSDLTYTATSATIATKFGIVLGPSDYVQGNQLDDFNSQSN